MNNDDGWGPWEDANQPDQDPVHDPIVQDHNSMILNPSMNSDDDADMEEVQQPLVHFHPAGPLDPINLVIVRVFYGPVLPPAMIWERYFKSLMPEFFIKNVPSCLPGLCFPPVPVKMSSPLLEKHLQYLAYGKSDFCTLPRSCVVLQEIPDDLQDPVSSNTSFPG